MSALRFARWSLLLAVLVLAYACGGDSIGSSTLGAICGGGTGTNCATREYCSYEPGADCGRADATAICKQRPEVCPAIYAPVCGCDGTTYSSACSAAAAGFGYDHEGACDGGSFCGGIAGIPCAAGQYCHMGVGVCLMPDGSGSCEPKPQACDLVYAPVCGCDGETYGNACAAAAAGVNVASDGECGGACSSNGVTFPDGTSGIPDGEGCNMCACSQGQLGCTAMYCPDVSCIVNGKRYADGDGGVPDPASCNTCSCVSGTVTGCTEMGCPLPAPCRFGREHYQDGEGFIAGTFGCTCHAGTFDCGPVGR